MTRRVSSFLWGGIAALIFIIVGIVVSVQSSDYMNLLYWGVLGVLSFTLVSCLVLRNNFVGEMIIEIFSWGFVKMPGIIFTLDLGGVIWLLAVKLLFMALGIALVLLCAALAIGLGMVVSLFVYPYAMYKNVTCGETE